MGGVAPGRPRECSEPYARGMNRLQDVILVHGLWHQPAHLAPLARALRARGTRVLVPQLHRGSLAADTAAVQAAVDASRSAPLVVGHSYGGAVITGLERVRGLVYVAAFVPDAGESCAALGGTAALINTAFRRNPDRSTRIDPQMARDYLYGDCSESLGTWATGLLVPQAPGHGRGIPERFAWRASRSTYVLCNQDRALDPGLQREMASRCERTVALDSSHSPFLSRTAELADILSTDA